MYALNAGPARSTNAFLDLETHLSAVEESGHRLAAATQTLRASARVFAQATARLQASARPRRRLQLVK